MDRGLCSFLTVLFLTASQADRAHRRLGGGGGDKLSYANCSLGVSNQ